MSAEVSSALEQRAHQLDAEADNNDTTRAHPSVLRFLADEYRKLSLMVQGRDPAKAAADEAAAAEAGGLRVERTDEAGAPVDAPPDAPAAQQAAQPQSGATA